MESSGIDYGNAKLNQIFNDTWPNLGWAKRMTHEEMLEEAEKRVKENIERAIEIDAEIEKSISFYRFFAVDYFATGEGMSFWLKICRNYGLYDGKDYELERFKEFIGCDHYFSGIEELPEEEFRTKYANLIPDYISKMLDKRDQPGFDWETHYHFNYS
jgi:hypothetical protein